MAVHADLSEIVYTPPHVFAQPVAGHDLLLLGAERLSSMAQWLLLHMIHTHEVTLDGSTPAADTFRVNAPVYLQSALPWVPVYVGHLLATLQNTRNGTHKNRSWLLSDGRSYPAVMAVDMLWQMASQGQLTQAGAAEALTRVCRDMQSYRIDDRNALSVSSAPVEGWSKNVSGMINMPGIADLQSIHRPLPGQELVAFLNQHAFEVYPECFDLPVWWRGEDCGLLAPLILVDQNCVTEHCADEFIERLRVCGFAPVVINNPAPHEIACVIQKLFDDLQASHRQVIAGQGQYPVALPCAVLLMRTPVVLATGSNLVADNKLRSTVCNWLKELYVEPRELEVVIRTIDSQYRISHKGYGKDWFTDVSVPPAQLPLIDDMPPGSRYGAPELLDDWFVALADSNPCHRSRLGITDEVGSVLMGHSLDHFRVRSPGLTDVPAESLNGVVVTGANIHSVAAAICGNRQGLNLLLCPEKQALSVFEQLRQQVLASRQRMEVDRQAEWISWPLILAPHTWQFSRDGLGGQSPALTELWLQEPADVAAMLFPIDGATLVASLETLYTQHGRIALMPLPCASIPVQLESARARQAVCDGVADLTPDAPAAADDQRLQLVTVGAQQTQAALRAARRLQQGGVACRVIAMLEPGRFRQPRDSREAAFVHSDRRIAELIPPTEERIVITHTRTDPMAGLLRRLHNNAENTQYLGYVNRGGKLDTFGMQFANRQSWAHILQVCLQRLAIDDQSAFLRSVEMQALTGSGNPDVLR